MNIVDLVLVVHRHLDTAGLSHAFGGALALNYLIDPRGTADIDINIFVPVARVDHLVEVFAELDLAPERSLDDLQPSAGLRFRHSDEPIPVDAFVNIDDSYREIEARLVKRPFGAESVMLPFLSAEDLALIKLSFGRAKDWVDLANMASALPDLDVDYIEHQLIRLRGPSMYPRLARLRSLLRQPRA